MQARSDGMSVVKELYEAFLLMPDTGFKDKRQFKIGSCRKVRIAYSLLYVIYFVPISLTRYRLLTGSEESHRFWEQVP